MKKFEDLKIAVAGTGYVGAAVPASSGDSGGYCAGKGGTHQ